MITPIVIDAAMPSMEPQGMIRKRRKNRKEGKPTVGEHVRQNRKFVMEWCTTPDEPVDRDVNGTLGQPLGERIEEQLRASV